MKIAAKVYNNRETPEERQARLRIENKKERQERIRAVERKKELRATAATDEKWAHNMV